MSVICVFAASSPANIFICNDLALLGKTIAQRGHSLVMGGMANGCMGVIGRAFLEAGGTATIIMPTEYVEYEAGFTHTNLLRKTTPDVIERIREFIAHADGFITCPGGIGTIGEAPHVIADNQASLYHPKARRPLKPNILYNRNNFFRGLLMQYDDAVHAGYIKFEHMSLIRHTAQVQDLVPMLEDAIAKAAQQANAA